MAYTLPCPWCSKKLAMRRNAAAGTIETTGTCRHCRRAVHLDQQGRLCKGSGPKVHTPTTRNEAAGIGPAAPPEDDRKRIGDTVVIPVPGPPPANNMQVGGSHYKDVTGEQHWDRMWKLFGPPWFVGNITKYAERYRLKNGLEDLAKVVHYSRKLQELETAYAEGTGVAPGTTGMAPGSAWLPLSPRK